MFIRAFLFFLFCLPGASVEARPRGAPQPNQIFYNIVTDGGANCNGSADTAPAFWAFRTWALANQGTNNQVVLTIPAGSDCAFQTNAGTVGGPLGGVSNTFIAGIHNLIVDGGAGVTLRQGASSYWLGNYGVCQLGLTSGSGCSARIQSASAGGSTVTLTSASFGAGYVSRFSVGDWIMVGGLDVQGQWQYACGYPMNQTYFEWRQVIGKNAGTGVLTLDRPLTNSYLDTWPNYNSGAPPGTAPSSACSNGEADNGGPATIWRVGFAGAEWNATVEFRGITFYQTSNQIYAGMRNVTYRNVVFTGGTLGAVPSNNETFTADNVSWGAVAMEVDKLIGTLNCNACSLNIIDVQSNSLEYLNLTNSTIAVNLIGGGRKGTAISDTSVTNWTAGSFAYGNTLGPVTCVRCNIANWDINGLFHDENPSTYSMSGGVISFPNTSASGGGPDQRWASPINGTFFFGTNGSSGFYSTIKSFKVLGITQDATNTYIQTDQAGGFPNFASLGGTRIQFRANGAYQFTCSNPNSASDPTFKAMCTDAGATPGVPAASYSKRSFAPSVNGSAGSVQGVGKLVSLTIDVTQAYTGSGTLTLGPAQFLNPTVKQSNWTNFDWFYSINLKQAGTRVITPAGVTCNGSAGGCSGDTSLTVPEAVWLWTGIGTYLNGTLSGGVNPQFTITLQTDQTP